MRPPSRTASMFITAALAAGIITTTATAASAGTGFGSCSAQGDFAICDASGTATLPVTITVTVTASPNQQVFVSWTDTCSVGTSAGGKSGSFTAQTPVSRTIAHPWHQPDSCIVAAGAQLQAGGNSVHVALSYSRTAAPAPASHEIKGYAGKCADDSGNSSAAGAKVIIWTCNTNDKAQAWTYANSQLKHNGKCLNDQHSGGNGSKVILYTCNSGANEKWTHKTNGEFVLEANGGKYCLDDPAYSKKNGTQLDVYRCSDGANQRWSLP